VIVSRQYAEGEVAINFLEEVIEKLSATREKRIEEPSDKYRTSKDRRIEEAVLYVKMQIAALRLQQGDGKACKTLLEEGKTTLESMTDVDPSVHASVHWVFSQYHKSRQEFAEFYKSALLYLAYTSVETLAEPFKLVSYFHLHFAYKLLQFANLGTS
jgi:26S proteasome regulatory subunit N9